MGRVGSLTVELETLVQSRTPCRDWWKLLAVPLLLLTLLVCCSWQTRLVNQQGQKPASYRELAVTTDGTVRPRPRSDLLFNFE